MGGTLERPPPNTRRVRKKSERSYLFLVIFTFVVVGGLLIALIFGWQSLLTALSCLLAGGSLILIPWLVLEGLQWWRNRME